MDYDVYNDQYDYLYTLQLVETRGSIHLLQKFHAGW